MSKYPSKLYKLFIYTSIYLRQSLNVSRLVIDMGTGDTKRNKVVLDLKEFSVL